MRLRRLKIQHFRGIDNAEFQFDSHTLLIGGNNVGKSTVCEALDLVLGPDRLGKFPPVEEFDFYNAQYISPDTEEPIPARIEVLLTDLSRQVELSCPGHIELWHCGEQRLLDRGEADVSASPEVVRCLRLETVARYDKDEDEFDAKTYFCHGTNNPDDSPQQVYKTTKRLFGFLYLRALRTGSRALSLERGSLLDRILQMQGVKSGLWESSIRRLRELNPPIADDAAELTPILENIEQRLAEYIQINTQNHATRLYVSKLTREHLRETISFFLSTSPGQQPVPFKEAGTGTLNTLVLALLSFIAEAKKDDVIFAMEEPEIALPPHTQRRIAKYLLTGTTQCFVTTHSPYVIEQFKPEQIQILNRDGAGNVTSTRISVASTIKEKMFKRHMRRGLAEIMLGKGVIVAEGISEQTALKAVAEQMESNDPDACYPLDLSGVTIFPVEGDGSLASFGTFFKTLGLRTYAFYDKKNRKPEETVQINQSFDLPNETPYSDIEKLLVAETPVAKQWEFLEAIRDSGEQPHIGIPSTRPSDKAIQDLMQNTLKCNKGSSYAADLIGSCDPAEVPATITVFLAHVYKDFPRPKRVQIPAAAPAVATQTTPSSGASTSN
jgi:putative ATP-dependent endonuclease of OLD family